MSEETKIIQSSSRNLQQQKNKDEKSAYAYKLERRYRGKQTQGKIS